MTSTGPGILAYGTYLPFHRLDRTEIAPIAGSGGGTGTRTVASYDEDTTTMAVEAARAVLPAPSPGSRRERGHDVGSLWFATTTPAYADKTNATAIHAALGLDPAVPAFDVAGAVRSTMGAIRAGLGVTRSARARLVDPRLSAGRTAGGRRRTGSDSPSPPAAPGWDASSSGGSGCGVTGATGATALVVAADVRTGLPGGADEAAGGDGAAALLVGTGTEDLPLLAEVLGWGSATAEFLDRWRAPGELRSKVWEERFGEGQYLEIGQRAWKEALAAIDVAVEAIDHVVVVSPHARAASSFRRSLSGSSATGERRNRAVGLDATVGFTGAAHPLLALAATLDVAGPGETLALVTLADGADVLLLRTTPALAATRAPSASDVTGAGGPSGEVTTAPGVRRGGPSASGGGRRAPGGRSPSVAEQVELGGRVAYGRYLAWRGLLPVEPPRRPEPARSSASAAGRSTRWKFGLVGSEAEDGTVHLPPSPRDAHDRPMADATGTIVTFTIDRMAYSPSPPVVFAVVDFDGGGRLPVELTDVDPAAVKVGDRVEMTFRRLFTADGIHNYFWKARPIRWRGWRGGAS